MFEAGGYEMDSPTGIDGGGHRAVEHARQDRHNSKWITPTTDIPSGLDRRTAEAELRYLVRAEWARIAGMWCGDAASSDCASQQARLPLSTMQCVTWSAKQPR
jgi:hypothetical protein